MLPNRQQGRRRLAIAEPQHKGNSLHRAIGDLLRHGDDLHRKRALPGSRHFIRHTAEHGDTLSVCKLLSGDGRLKFQRPGNQSTAYHRFWHISGHSSHKLGIIQPVRQLQRQYRLEILRQLVARPRASCHCGGHVKAEGLSLPGNGDQLLLKLLELIAGQIQIVRHQNQGWQKLSAGIPVGFHRPDAVFPEQLFPASQLFRKPFHNPFQRLRLVFSCRASHMRKGLEASQTKAAELYQVKLRFSRTVYAAHGHQQRLEKRGLSRQGHSIYQQISVFPEVVRQGKLSLMHRIVDQAKAPFRSLCALFPVRSIFPETPGGQKLRQIQLIRKRLRPELPCGLHSLSSAIFLNHADHCVNLLFLIFSRLSAQGPGHRLFPAGKRYRADRRNFLLFPVRPVSSA